MDIQFLASGFENLPAVPSAVRQDVVIAGIKSGSASLTSHEREKVSKVLHRVEERCSYEAVSLLSTGYLELYWYHHMLYRVVAAFVVAFLLQLPKQNNWPVCSKHGLSL